MILITSAATVQGDLKSEFGELPPAFLPLGNRSLLSWQLRATRSAFPNESIFLSLPEGFVCDVSQQKLISDWGVRTLFVPQGLTLSQSVLFALNVSGAIEGELRILHGDTLVGSMPQSLDLIGVASIDQGYDWHRVELVPMSVDRVWCGFFSFSDIRQFVRELALSPMSFEVAVKSYSSVVGTEMYQFDEWLDLGHLNTYFHAREKFTTQRSFNHLRIGDGCVVKSGEPPQKILAEANWYQNLPAKLRKFTPALYSKDVSAGSYTLEYLPMTPLNEQFVHGRHSLTFWFRVFRMLEAWFTEATSPDHDDLDELLVRRRYLIEEKSWSRIEEYAMAVGLDIEKKCKINGVEVPSVKAIVSDLIERANRSPILPGILHGDLCFSNLVLDSRNGRLRVIDPRGHLDLSDNAPVDDLVYDVAKFAHSAIGFYDLIVAGNCVIEVNRDANEYVLDIHTTRIQKQVANQFLKFPLLGDANLIQNSLPQMILLFLTMVPLHADNQHRQDALFANGLRLYSELLKRDKERQ